MSADDELARMQEFIKRGCRAQAAVDAVIEADKKAARLWEIWVAHYGVTGARRLAEQAGLPPRA